MNKNNLTFEEYKNKVIDGLIKMKHCKEFIERFNEYKKSDELDNDIKLDYELGASVNACIYNLYMWI